MLYVVMYEVYAIKVVYEDLGVLCKMLCTLDCY